jgi:hypothetical protein
MQVDYSRAWRGKYEALTVLVLAACASETREREFDEPDGHVKAESGAPSNVTDARGNVCERLLTELANHASAHRDCTSDTDCSVVGGCDGFDFYPVNRTAESRANEYLNELYLNRCEHLWDGPGYEGACENGRCELREIGQCGCLPGECGPTPDGGP